MLIVYYLINAALMGSLTVLIIAAAKKQDGDFELLKKIVFISAILQLVALAVYAMVLGASVGTYADHGTYFDPTLPDIPQGRARGRYRLAVHRVVRPGLLGRRDRRGRHPADLAFRSCSTRPRTPARP
jgi:type III secretory pathway component EscS